MMISRTILAAVLLVCSLSGETPTRVKRKVTDAEVMRIHNAAILIDTHNDITSRTVAGTDIGQSSTTNHTDLPRMTKGGMGAQFFAVYVAAGYTDGNHSAKRALDMIDTVKHDIIAKYPADFVFATSAADIREAHRQHKIAALMGIEGGHAIEDDLRVLRDFYDLGVRYMMLTHATIADVVKHINHVAGIAGIDAIGLGSDFDGVSCVPEGLDGVDKWPNLTRALLEEGYSKDDVLKIYGGNTLRLMTQVEKTAAEAK